MIDLKRIRADLFGRGTPNRETNAGLWLSKYVQDQTQDEGRRCVMDEVREYMPEPGLYATAYARWEQLVTQQYRAQTRQARVKGRMIVGLGSESVLETSICLHRTYGVPSIPGSALKGLAASYAHQRLGEKWQKGGAFHKLVFGTTDEAGYLTFFDAWYLPGSGPGGKALFPDVITVHHQNYYQGEGDAPSDTDDPIPVPFLSASGTYLLALAAPDLDPKTRWIDLTFEILTQALARFGIGAKTSSGYGRMEILAQPATYTSAARAGAAEPSIDPEVTRARDAKSRLEDLKESDVAGQINSYYQQWKQLTSQEAQEILAEAIFEKVRKVGREKVSAEKNWYKEVIMFLQSIRR